MSSLSCILGHRKAHICSPTFEDTAHPACLHLCHGHDGSKGPNQPKDSQGGLLQVGWEHVFVEGCVLVFHPDHGFFQEGEGDDVARGEDNNINGLLLRAVVEKD